jgi:hypothetical protein
MRHRISLLVAGFTFLVLVVGVATATALTTSAPSTTFLPAVYKQDSPTPTVTPTNTATPTKTATPTNTATPANTATSTPVSFSDDFSNPNSGWPVAEDSIAKVGYLNGEYQILLKQNGYIDRAGPGVQEADFQVEADARAAASTQGTAGLYFGAVNNVGFYDFEVGFGAFSPGRYDEVTPSNSVVLIQPPASSAVNQGNTSNHVKVTRKGSVITLFANGVQLAQISDSTLGFGFVGLAASSYADNFDARFDNFHLVEAAPQAVRVAGTRPTQLAQSMPLAALRQEWSSVSR